MTSPSQAPTPAQIIEPRPPAGAPPRPVIRLVDVHKRFGPQVVLSGLSLDFPEGQTTVILGPSGCGKSVMLRHIVGLTRPDAGEVHACGRRVDTMKETELAAVRLQIGFLFQMSALFDSMSVRDNIEFPLVEHTTLSPYQRTRRVAKALATVDMSGAENKLPSQLSGGQRKRVALARAIVLEPRVILYDEPTTGLDPIRADGINELVLKLKREMGVTGVLVTHDLISARKVADRLVMLLNGRVAAQGSFEDLLASPDPHVRHFMAGHYDATEDQ